MDNDLVVGFESRTEAVQFLEAFQERLAKFGLELKMEIPGASPLTVISASDFGALSAIAPGSRIEITQATWFRKETMANLFTLNIR